MNLCLKCTCILLHLLTSVSLIAEESYRQQFVHYKMDVTLLPIEHTVIGEETIHYHNNSPDTLDQIFMHLYPNAYKDEHAINVQEGRKFYRRVISSPEEGGYIDIESFSIRYSDDENKTAQLFEVRDTILHTDLTKPLSPGDSLTIHISFKNKVRKHNRRAGYRGFQYDMAHWYPKICVYDENGWNARPFHYLGEFYGEFGTFDVTINTPYEYVIGATGVVVAGDPGWELVTVDTAISAPEWPARHEEIQKNLRAQASNGHLRTVTFHAENVHDFAWNACPDFLYERGEWNGIPIHVLYRSRAKYHWSKTAAQRAAKALAWLSEKVGLYPYPQLTLVHGLLGGGMEYPMLNMNSHARHYLILHEIAHIYFYGILGNNEWKEAWLDEGFSDFFERWYLETLYGPWGFDRNRILKNGNWLQRKRPLKTIRESHRERLLWFMRSGHDEPLSRPAERYNEPAIYSATAYTKGSFFFDMLKYVVGDSTFERICHAYFEKWKFKHVNEARFRQVCEEVSGQDLSWFFDQWLHKTPKIDYAIGDVRRTKNDSAWTTEVSIIKNEKGSMPVDVELRTSDNKKHRIRWHGLEKTGSVVFETDSPPGEVILDPEDQIFDLRRANNGGTAFKLLFDYPGLSYAPRNAYLVTWRPTAWYNDVDKARLGVKLRGRHEIYRRVELGVWYGTDSKTLDAQLRYSHPITMLGPRTQGTVFAQKMEGRREFDAHLQFTRSKYLFIEPSHNIWIGFNHTKLLDGNYVLQKYDQKDDFSLPGWDEGSVNKLYVRYQTNPRTMNVRTNITLGFDTVQRDWGSDFTYSSAFTEVKIWYPDHAQGLFARIFAKGLTDGGAAPVQERIFLDGANPRAKFKRHFLRSTGGFPEELHYHLPGGGNLRGYYNNPIIGEQILALNLEASKKFRWPWLERAFKTVLGRASINAFFDMATLEFLDIGADFFADAGLGLRFQKQLPDTWYTFFTGGRNVTLRLDFPIWVNNPLPDEKEVRFRWVFGFERVL